MVDAPDILHRSPNHPSARAVSREHDGSKDSLPIFLDGVQVGTLKRDGENTFFVYNEKAKRLGLFISAAMKDVDQAYEGKFNDLPAFFAGLLPEGKRRDAVASSLGISTKDEFGLYEVLGAEVIGNTRTFTKEGAAYVVSGIDVLEGIAANMSFVEMLQTASDIASPDFDSHSVPGVQNKVTRVLNQLRNADVAHGNHSQILPLVILKLEEPKYKQLVPNEAFFLDVAEKAGLKPANHTLVTDESGRPALMVERFDRRMVDGEIVRIYTEDACQLQGKHPREKYEGSYQRTCAAILEAVDDPARAAEELYRAYAFSFGIGNGDLHAKNLSIWKNPDSGEVEIAPTYDVLCSYVYNDKSMALAVATDKNKLVKKDISSKTLLRLATDLGIDPERASEITQEVSGAIRESIDSIGKIGLNQHAEIVCKKLLTHRAKVLDNVVERAQALQNPAASRGLGD